MSFPTKHGDFHSNVSLPADKPTFSHNFPMVFLGFQHFPMGFPGFSYGFQVMPSAIEAEASSASSKTLGWNSSSCAAFRVLAEKKTIGEVYDI